MEAEEKPLGPIPAEQGQLLYNEAVRRLAAQDVDLTNIRTRAGSLVGIVGVVTTFFATLAIAQSTSSHQTLDWKVLVPTAPFVVALGIALWVLTATVELKAGFNSSKIKIYIEEHQPSIGYLAAHMAIQMDDAIECNRPTLRRQRCRMRAFAAAFGVEVVAWLIFLFIWR
ncbi:MAG: hypothetical protein U0U69_05775 [Acidimicrobiia bacterium]